MARVLLCHGAWSAAWAWVRMRPRFAAAGHELFVPTYTGLGEREHLARPEVSLTTHIDDVVGVAEAEELTGLTLLGHSYGGIVATGVAARIPEKIARIVYLDAFVPEDGQSLFDLVPSRTKSAMQAAAAETGDGWRVPPNPAPPDTAPEDVAWVERQRCPMPIACLSEPVAAPVLPDVPRDYIYATRTPPGDPFGRFAAMARASSGWTLHEIDASHSPAITAPDALMRVLDGILA